MRRVIVYTIWDRRGGVEDYVRYALDGLRPHADLLIAVVNGTLDEAGAASLDAVCDEVIVRENRGYDIWAHKAAIDALGDRLADYDELLLTNDTWFGPVRPFGDVFASTDDREVDFWSLTDHAREEPNPFTGKGVLAYHLQSFWIAVRSRMFLSEAWRDYWRDLPELPDYYDAVLVHETLFTEHFATRGFSHHAVFSSVDYPTDHPALFNADLLVADGCPVVKRRTFFHYPVFLDRHAVSGRRIARLMGDHGYPLEILWRNLARTVPPHVLNTNAAMLEVLPDVDTAFDPSRAPRVLVAMHVYYVEMADEMLDLAERLPGEYDVVMTTSDEERGAALRAVLERRPHGRGRASVRVVESNDGRDQTAFLIGCRDLLRSGEYDLVVKLHSKKTPQDGFNIGRHFREQQFDNLLASPGHAAGLLALFQREPGLGIVYPPMIHIGYPTMGHAWWANKPGAEALCRTLGIAVPLDDSSPLAPYGSMFVARPEALRLLVDHPWTYAEFGSQGYADGALTHVLERLPSYAAGELGYHTRTVATPDYISLSHTAMEFKLDELSMTLPGDAMDSIDYLRGVGQVGSGRIVDFVRMYFRLHHPGTGAALRRVVGAHTPFGRALRRLRRSR